MNRYNLMRATVPAHPGGDTEPEGELLIDSAADEFDGACEFVFIDNTRGTPPQKLADMDLIFRDPPFDGLKLEGFAIWSDDRGRTIKVAFPSRRFREGHVDSSTHQTGGDYPLLRGVDRAEQRQPLERAIVKAYRDHVARKTANRLGR